MNEEHKIETDELICLYLDGEASVRQQTELKRLMQHDPSIAKRMEALRRQQQILNALPIETAPDSVHDDICSAIERQLILNGTPETSRSIIATSHFFIRRLITAAAMILLPLGVLGLVVFQIMKPPSAAPVEYVSADQMIGDTDTAVTSSQVSTEISTPLPFEGLLVLETNQYMEVSDAIGKAVLDKGLLNRAFPQRTAEGMSFDITASPKIVAELFDFLTTIRPQCDSAKLRLGNCSNEQIVEIIDPQTKQLKTLIYQDNPEMLQRLATRYASANKKSDTLYADKVESSELGDDGYPKPSIPELASKDSVNKTVRLTIRIQRSE